MYKRQKAFTLVELMVVVAIIAILGTMSVGNFSSAIRRTRNSVRVSDMQAVSKAMEVCYDALSGKYVGVNQNGGQNTEVKNKSSVSGTLFDVETNTCLNNSVIPSMENYPYSDKRIYDSGKNDLFVVCAKLEKVGGWETVANSGTDASGYSRQSSTNRLQALAIGSCTADADEGQCYYCIQNQQ